MCQVQYLFFLCNSAFKSQKKKKTLENKSGYLDENNVFQMQMGYVTHLRSWVGKWKNMLNASRNFQSSLKIYVCLENVNS